MATATRDGRPQPIRRASTASNVLNRGTALRFLHKTFLVFYTTTNHYFADNVAPSLKNLQSSDYISRGIAIERCKILILLSVVVRNKRCRAGSHNILYAFSFVNMVNRDALSHSIPFLFC